MASHWPVIVGINQYQLLQPLMYAQFDAIELKDFLVHEAGIPPQNCALLTDVSPMVYQGSAFPSREVILQRLAQTMERAAAEDIVWFFFSGYGVHWEGQDYLLPIDADPNRIAQTGILVETLFKTLTEKTPEGKGAQPLVILDMNRPQSSLAPSRLGQQTLELAQDLSIPLLLSCQPHEFSQETLAVRHGLFSEAMIEGLRFHGCLTLTQLADYLTSRVPELCRHHWRPEQHPVAVIPPEQKFLMLVPPSAVGQITGGELPQTNGPVFVVPPLVEPEMPSSPEPQSLESSSPEPASPEPDFMAPVAPEDFFKKDEAASSSAPLPPAPLPSVEPEEPTPQVAEAPGWQQWGLLVAGVLLLGVLLRNQSVFWGNRTPVSEPGSVATEPVVPSQGEAPAAEGSQSPPASPEPAPVDGSALFPGTSIDPATALGLARTALTEQQFGEALTWLNQIPEDQRPEDYANLVAEAEAGLASAVMTGEAVLNDARRLVEPLPASLFNDAIERARQVPIGDPMYEQAQADINRWSQVILDLAEGRAATGNFDGAIAAAQLVPADQAEVYAQAQAAIQGWQQRQTNRQLLQQAQSLLQPDQATSFKEAILLAQQVPPDYPEYPTAQERIGQWSQDILVIARARAAAGDIPGAIAAAERVPPGTPAYDQAQQEILGWQGQ